MTTNVEIHFVSDMLVTLIHRLEHSRRQQAGSKHKSTEVVHNLAREHLYKPIRPWSHNRDREPTQGLTGLLDPKVIDDAIVDPNRRPENTIPGMTGEALGGQGDGWSRGGSCVGFIGGSRVSQER